MKKSILIIDNHDSFTYNLVDLLRGLKVSFQVCQVEKIDLALANKYSHLLISPGPDIPRAYPNLFIMIENFYQQKSILGVCLGHQMLCEFFGGSLYNLEQVRHGKNGQLKLINGGGRLFQNIPQGSEIGLYHSWAVKSESFPTDLKVTAYCEEGVVMAMEHRHLPIFGVQFHPESFITTYGENIFLNWLSL